MVAPTLYPLHHRFFRCLRVCGPAHTVSLNLPAGPMCQSHRLLLLPKSKPPARPRALLAAPPPVRRHSEPASTLCALRRRSTPPPAQKLCTASPAPRPCSTLLAAHPLATANALRRRSPTPTASSTRPLTYSACAFTFQTPTRSSLNSNPSSPP